MKSMKNFTLRAVLFLFFYSNTVLADDTDIYLNPKASGGAPYLMFMMDYRSDLSATFCSANGANKCSNVLSAHPDLLASLESVAGVGNAATNMQALIAVLKVVFDKFEGIYVGLMIPNDDNGGTILRGYEEFQAGDANGAKADLINILSSIPLPSTGNQYHDTAPKETHAEWYSYVNGLAVQYGDQTADNFQSTNTPSYDASIISSGNYVSPFASTPSSFECTKLYEVYATSGNTGGSDDDLDSLIASAMGGASSYEEMVSYMTYNDVLTSVPGDQSLKTWYIQMGSAATFTDDWAIAADTNDQYMNVGGGGADLFDVQAKLEAAFVEALSVSTTFVAASVPVNVFNRIQTLDDFYIALFEANATARWPGNLKKLKLSDSDLDGVPDTIVDTLGQTAFSSLDGRIKYETLSFWTDVGALPPAIPEKSEVADRDGRSVERGGAGQKIPGFISGSIGDSTTTGTRQVYLEPASGTTFATFDVSQAASLTAALGAADVNEARDVIRWARGQDADDDDGDGDFSEARSWIMGDAIHSRPLTINYGARGSYTQTNPDIRLFMGTNDGYFHSFKNTNADGSESGAETFAFVPRELLGNFKVLKDNVTSDHPYGVDGEPVALVKDLDSDGTLEPLAGESAKIYFGLRRGGKSVYALDISNPDNISFISKIGKTTSGFGELGLTFSTPKVGKVRFGGLEYDVLIFAGGYDVNKDGDIVDPDGNRGADSEGRAVFIVDANSGALIWKVSYGASTGGVSNTSYTHAAMQYSIPSEVATLDSNQNGIIDRIYVGDTGGLVWRIDVPEGNLSSETNHRLNRWSAMVLADLSDAADSEDVRFFHRPELVQTSDSAGNDYDAVVLSSGDRANPLESDDTNYLYVIKDTNINSGSPPSSIIDDTDLADVTGCASSCTGLDYSKGWKLQFSSSGEKGLSTPLVSAGKIFNTTYVPNSGLVSSCAPAEGSGKIYVSNLNDGTELYSGSRGIELGPGIPASPIALSGDLVLLPGNGLDSVPPGLDISGNAQLLQFNNKSLWILYWHHTGFDSL